MSSAQVPEGYKQTEVGVIPEDWQVRPLLSTISIATGQVDPRDEPYKSMVLVAPDHVETMTGRLLELQTAEDQGAISGKYLFNSGDIIYSKIRPYLRKVILADFRGMCSADMYPLTPAKDVSSAFIFAVLLGHRFSQFAENVSARSGIPKINREELAEYTVALPPLPEQQTIAQALSDVDALIASLDKLIAKQRHLKTAAMQQLLTGKMRSPGFGEGKGYKQTEIGVIPEDWDVRYLGEVGQSLIGLTYRPEDTRDHGTLVLRSSNVQNDRLAYENNVYVDSSLPLPSRVIVEEGDILICVRNGSKQLIGKSALIDAEAAGSAFGAFMSVFRTKISGFVFYQFQSDVIQTQINEIMGATINQITNKDMAAFQIPLPPSDEEQRAIATVLSEMDTAITALETRRSKTQAIKQGMMQELLTGRTRLV
jgi:type I restriction enzyme, S subunit